MKRFALALMFLALPAFAAPSLKDNMESLGSLFKTIKYSVTDRGQNAANAQNADKMITLFRAVRSQTPDTILSLPEAKRPAAMADYQKMIDFEIQLVTNLKAALLKNDNNTAAGIVTQMDSAKRDGHNKYK